METISAGNQELHAAFGNLGRSREVWSMDSTQTTRAPREDDRTHELLRRSMERIHISLALLNQDLPVFARQQERPICEKCKAEMAWCRSFLRASDRTVTNVFTCGSCGMAAETVTQAKVRVEM